MTLDEMDLSEVLDAAIEHKKFYNFEGSRGVERMAQVFEMLGYSPSSGSRGMTIPNFFEDNPGAIEAVLEWVKEQNVTRWKDNVAQVLINSGHLFDNDSDEEFDDDEESLFP